jgi:hypothetical protein
MHQGDHMSLQNIAENVTQTHFCLNENKTFSVEKSSPNLKICSYYFSNKKMPLKTIAP